MTAGQAFGTSVSVDANTNRINSAGYAYDADGNMTNDTNHSYTFDAENRITSVDGTVAAYTYLGSLRVERQFGGTTVYVYSGTVPIAEYRAGDPVAQPLKEYIYAGSQLLATMDATNGTSYQYHDHLSTRVEADASGTITRTFGHFPFGEVWYETGTASKWKFTTYERDTESALDYAEFRFDSSRLGRFMSADRLAGDISNPESLDRYSYVVGDSVNLADAMGLDPGIACLLDSNGNCAGFLNGGGFGCILDGFMTPCSMVAGVAASGAGVPCPVNIDCLWTQWNPVTGNLQYLSATHNSSSTSGSGEDDIFTIFDNVNWHFGWTDIPWQNIAWQVSYFQPLWTIAVPVGDVPVPVGVGVTVTATVIPGTRTGCLSGTPTIAFPASKSVTVGPVVNSGKNMLDPAHTQAIVSGLTYVAFSWIPGGVVPGMTFSVNGNGALVGPAWGSPGVSVGALGYGRCHNF